MAESVREFHRDLVRKYQLHGSQIVQIWSSLNQDQRTKAMKAGAADGADLKDRLDRSLGNAYQFIPEWNLRTIIALSSNRFLEVIKHRATTSLLEQYVSGVNGGTGDYGHILEMKDKHNLELVNPSDFKDCWTLFLTNENYGTSYKFTGKTIAPHRVAIENRMVVPQAIGELVLYRQLYLLRALSIIIEYILEAESTSHTQKQRPDPSLDAATAGLANFSFRTTKNKVELFDLFDAS
ncbi:hypothetical protein DM02DRAFT_695237 [Periconia macrospinosa]|uniref:Uncharacterized protein n=1 Tax=Periconia macrospinosa TaxID=97972 RepID=A0A2V1D6N6_9PLEO|nr:hypothetical protein DM02DRAFT_695237 [Periconia macrospinosa]